MRFYFDDEEDTGWELVSGVEPMRSLEVEVTPNEVVAVLFGADGDVLLEVCERPSVPFGFQAPAAASGAPR